MLSRDHGLNVSILVMSILCSMSTLLQSCKGSRTPSLDEPFQQSSFHQLSQSPCVQLFTRDKSIGCGTYDREEVKGTLLHWSTLTLGESYSSASNTLPSFVAVLEEGDYTVALLQEMIDTGSLKGVLLLANSTSTLLLSSESASQSESLTSPAPTYPRGQNTPSSNLNQDYGGYSWNPNGDALMLESFYKIPTGYVINDPDMATYLQQISIDQSHTWLTHSPDNNNNNDNNNDRSIYATSGILDSVNGVVAQFNLYMGKNDITTKQCLAWTNTNGGQWAPMCLPLGGNSVWATAGSPYAYQQQHQDNDNDNDNARNRNRELEEENEGYYDQQDDNQGDGKKTIVMVATNMDSSSMFHDVAPGANTAASNILALLMAAKLIGESLSDAALDNLEKKIMFVVFQAETYGFMGSTSFLNDVVLGFQCDDGLHVPANVKGSKNKNADADGTTNKQKMACLSPFRYDTDFTQLGQIDSMIAVDQIGIPTTDGTLYAHSDNADGGTLSTIITSLSSSSYTIQQGSANSIPPTPLTTLLRLTDGQTGGVVLSGYDDAFAQGYLSHLDANATRPIDMQAVAFAATALARAALTAASGDDDYDAEGVVPELDYDDDDLLELADCLLNDGNCNLLVGYGKMENNNVKREVGHDLGIGGYLGKPPSYYTGVFDKQNGQGFVQVGGQWYGSYTGSDYGKDDGDAVMVRPSLLEMGIHGLLDDYLGRGSATSDANGDEQEQVQLKSCSHSGDCSDVSYCSSPNVDRAVCSGTKVCVCSRARYHMALDEAIYPAPNNATSYFLVKDEDDDAGVSAMYSEPMWSADIGVEVYRDTDRGSGNWMLLFGFISAAGWVSLTVWTKRKLVDAKLY